MITLHCLPWRRSAFLFLVLVLMSGSLFAAVEAEISPPALRKQAIQLFREGDRLEALAVLQRARTGYEALLVDHPQSVDAARGLAMTLFDLGEYEASRTVFDRMRGLEDATIQGTLVAQEPGVGATQVVEVVEAPDYLLAPNPESIRGIDVHPNILYEATADGIARNIMAFVARASALNVNTVFVHAFTKPNAAGAFDGAYLALPKEILLAALGERHGAFALLSGEDTSVSPPRSPQGDGPRELGMRRDISLARGVPSYQNAVSVRLGGKLSLPTTVSGLEDVLLRGQLWVHRRRRQVFRPRDAGCREPASRRTLSRSR